MLQKKRKKKASPASSNTTPPILLPIPFSNKVIINIPTSVKSKSYKEISQDRSNRARYLREERGKNQNASYSKVEGNHEKVKNDQ
jgi:hypothetical protein